MTAFIDIHPIRFTDDDKMSNLHCNLSLVYLVNVALLDLSLETPLKKPA